MKSAINGHKRAQRNHVFSGGYKEAILASGSWLPGLLSFRFEQLAFDSRALVNHQGWVPVGFESMRFAAIGLAGIPCYPVAEALIARD